MSDDSDDDINMYDEYDGKYIKFEEVMNDVKLPSIIRQVARTIHENTYTCAGKIYQATSFIDMLILSREWDMCVKVSREQGIPIRRMAWFNFLVLISDMIQQAEGVVITKREYKPGFDVSLMMFQISLFIASFQGSVDITDVRKITMNSDFIRNPVKDLLKAKNEAGERVKEIYDTGMQEMVNLLRQHEERIGNDDSQTKHDLNSALGKYKRKSDGVDPLKAILNFKFGNSEEASPVQSEAKPEVKTDTSGPEDARAKLSEILRSKKPSGSA